MPTKMWDVGMVLCSSQSHLYLHRFYIESGSGGLNTAGKKPLYEAKSNILFDKAFVNADKRIQE